MTINVFFPKDLYMRLVLLILWCFRNFPYFGLHGAFLINSKRRHSAYDWSLLEKVANKLAGGISNWSEFLPSHLKLSYNAKVSDLNPWVLYYRLWDKGSVIKDTPEGVTVYRHKKLQTRLYFIHREDWSPYTSIQLYIVTPLFWPLRATTRL